MSWKSYAAEARGGGHSSAIKADEATMRLFTPKDNKHRLVIRIGPDILKKAKLAPKDTVDLLVNEDASKVLIKKSEKGWKLFPVGHDAVEFNVPWRDRKLFDFDSKTAVKLDYSMAEGGIVLTVPKQEAE